jgi:beta-galactosidase
MSISEYGAGGAITQHSDNVTAGYLNFTGRPQPEEFESFVHEQNWPAIRDRKFVFASWVWNMFDFASDLRDEGDSVDLNTKGLVTFDRKTRKDAFYFYKAQWSDQPVLQLTGKRYVDRAYPTMEVRAYSNAAKATLTLNGQTIGEVACPDTVCVWPNVALRPGPNAVVATATALGHTISDTAIWNGPDPRQGIRIKAGDLAGVVVAGPNGAERRFGSDNFVTGGQPAVLNMGGFGGRRLMAVRSVSAPDPQLYEFWREGEAFSYAIPVPNGAWTVTIHTFEPRAAAPDTLMTVKANGAVALPPLNVKQAAGGALKGLSRSFPVRVTNGVLRLDFSGAGGKAVVAAIEVSR